MSQDSGAKEEAAPEPLDERDPRRVRAEWLTPLLAAGIVFVLGTAVVVMLDGHDQIEYRDSAKKYQADKAEYETTRQKILNQNAFWQVVKSNRPRDLKEKQWLQLYQELAAMPTNVLNPDGRTEAKETSLGLIGWTTTTTTKTTTEVNGRLKTEGAIILNKINPDLTLDGMRSNVSTYQEGGLGTVMQEVPTRPVGPPRQPSRYILWWQVTPLASIWYAIRAACLIWLIGGSVLVGCNLVFCGIWPRTTLGRWPDELGLALASPPAYLVARLPTVWQWWHIRRLARTVPGHAAWLQINRTIRTLERLRHPSPASASALAAARAERDALAPLYQAELAVVVETAAQKHADAVAIWAHDQIASVQTVVESLDKQLRADLDEEVTRPPS